MIFLSLVQVSACRCLFKFNIFSRLLYPIKTKNPSQKPIGFNGTGDNFLRYHPSCVKNASQCNVLTYAPRITHGIRLAYLRITRSVCPHESIHIGIRYRTHTACGSLASLSLHNDPPKLLLSIIGLKYYDMIIPLNELQFKYISKIFYVRIITNAIAAA